jgi:DNA replication protein DnaC
MSTTHPAAPARRIIPAPPTRDELAAQYDRAQAEAARLEAERLAEEQDRVEGRKARLEERTRRFMAEAAKLTNPERIRIMEGDNPGASWTDPSVAQADGTLNRWQRSIAAADKTALAAWQLDDVEDVNARLTLARFVDQLAGAPIKLNCILVGPTRTGKTSSAMAAGHYAVNRREPISTLFVDHKGYLDAMRPTDSADKRREQEALKRQVRDAQLLIIDDFGAGMPVPPDPTPSDPHPRKDVTPFVNDATLGLIGKRVETGKATIITTNLTKDQISRMFDARIPPRITEDAVAVRLTKPIKDQIDF